MSNDRKTETLDIGFTIRDLIEGAPISHIETNGGKFIERRFADTVTAVDASDPSNLIFRMHTGAKFTVRIEKAA